MGKNGLPDTPRAEGVYIYISGEPQVPMLQLLYIIYIYIYIYIYITKYVTLSYRLQTHVAM